MDDLMFGADHAQLSFRWAHLLAGADIAQQLPRPYKVAGLARPEEMSDSADAGSTDHGSDFRVFADEDEALMWLLSGGFEQQPHEDEALMWLLFEPARRGGCR